MRGNRRQAAIATIGVSLLFLGGCSTWFGEAEAPPLPGKRISVLAYDAGLEPDPLIAGQPVSLGSAVRNSGWPQAGGSTIHAIGQAEGPTAFERPAWDVDIGSSAGSSRPILTGPIIADGRVFTMDSKYGISAYSEDNGKRLWRVEREPVKRDWEAFGGGLAFDSGKLYLTTGYGKIEALTAEDGSLIWEHDLPGPVRAAPMVMDGTVFAVSTDNQLFAVDAETGQRKWRHAGFAETARLLGEATPAGIDGTVIVPYSSGEIFALRADDGHPLWSDNLAAVRRVDAASALTDIRALPVTDGALVYAISHSGRTVAIDLRTGARAWERNVGGVRTPWIAGDWLFMLSNEAQVITLSRREGKVRWITQLDRFGDPENHEDPIHWYGPLVVSGKVLVVGDNGKTLALDPADGSITGTFDTPGGVMAVAVANGTIYLQTRSADLYAYR
jgi:outer membrane protein assembly factor BamB